MSRLTRWWRRRKRARDPVVAEEQRLLAEPSALAAEDATADAQGLAIPPPLLRARVAGSPSMRGYLDVGKHVADAVVARLRDAQVDVASLRRLVDFGCGCGRVLRFLPALVPGASFVGLDVDAEAIAWCRTGLSSLGTFREIPHHPPTAEAAAAFDTLIAISVFTHLPPEMQTAWIAEWARLISPGGVVLFTVSHPDRRARYRNWLRHGVERDGTYYYRVGAQEGHPDWYQAAFLTDEAATRLAQPHFDVLRIERDGISAGQTSVVCRRR